MESRIIHRMYKRPKIIWFYLVLSVCVLEPNLIPGLTEGAREPHWQCGQHRWEASGKILTSLSILMGTHTRGQAKLVTFLSLAGTVYSLTDEGDWMAEKRGWTLRLRSPLRTRHIPLIFTVIEWVLPGVWQAVNRGGQSVRVWERRWFRTQFSYLLPVIQHITSVLTSCH